MKEGKIPSIQLIECPRDAMQGWPRFIPTKDKIRYLNALLEVGFHTLDFGSFVSHKIIPQMADTAELVNQLVFPQHCKTQLLAIVANLKGAEEAIQFERIQCLGFPFSISPSFQMRNTHASMEKSLETVEAIHQLCIQHGKTLVIYLSMGFGNPYGDPYSIELLLHWANEMVDRGIGIISLADTIGMAEPEQISQSLEQLIPAYPQTQFGVHLHSKAELWESKFSAALTAGCLRFDGALKGIGGCPMAEEELVGNLDSILMIRQLQALAVLDQIDEIALNKSIQIANEIFQ